MLDVVGLKQSLICKRKGQSILKALDQLEKQPTFNNALGVKVQSK
jgi:hypothetical protein